MRMMKKIMIKRVTKTESDDDNESKNNDSNTRVIFKIRGNILHKIVVVERKQEKDRKCKFHITI